VTTTAAHAFDAVASRYDTEMSPLANPLVAMIRARFYQAIDRHFRRGSALLELGCGTGDDALALASRGYRIVATDIAAAMVERARAKVTAAGWDQAVQFQQVGAAALAGRWRSLGQAVDGVYSNLAPLNCEPSLEPLRRLLEQALPPGGRFVGVVLPRVCPLEIALFLARGQPRTALRRLARAPHAEVDGRRFPLHYWGAADFDRALGPGFRRIETRSLGLLLPPLRFGPTFARVPGLLEALAAVEDRVSALPGLARMGDHVLLAYERRRSWGTPASVV
jgi:SAM-dependent methyltransferase